MIIYERFIFYVGWVGHYIYIYIYLYRRVHVWSGSEWVGEFMGTGYGDIDKFGDLDLVDQNNV